MSNSKYFRKLSISVILKCSEEHLRTNCVQFFSHWGLEISKRHETGLKLSKNYHFQLLLYWPQNFKTKRLFTRSKSTKLFFLPNLTISNSFRSTVVKNWSILHRELHSFETLLYMYIEGSCRSTDIVWTYDWLPAGTAIIHSVTFCVNFGSIRSRDSCLNFNPFLTATPKGSSKILILLVFAQHLPKKLVCKHFLEFFQLNSSSVNVAFMIQWNQIVQKLQSHTISYGIVKSSFCLCWSTGLLHTSCIPRMWIR